MALSDVVSPESAQAKEVCLLFAEGVECALESMDCVLRSISHQLC